jgi:hypothetical protein
MPENIFRTRTPIDFSAVTSTAVQSIMEAKAENAKLREEAENSFLQTQKVVNDYALLAAKNPNDYFYSGATQMRDYVYELSKAVKSGQMSISEYTRNKNRLLLGIDNYSNWMEESSTLSQERIKRATPDEKTGRTLSGRVEAFNTEKTASLLDFSNKEMRVANDGTIMSAQIDPETGEIVDIFSEGDMFALDNNFQNRYYMDDMIAGVADKMGNFKFNKINKVKGGREAISYNGVVAAAEAGETHADKAFNRARKNAINEATSDANMASSLLDNGVDYTFYDDNDNEILVIEPYMYETEDQRLAYINDYVMKYEKALEENGIEPIDKAELMEHIEGMGVQMVRGDDRVYRPALTDYHKERVTERVDEQLAMNLGYDVTTAFRPNSSGGNSSNKDLKAGDIDPLYVAYTTNKVFYGELSKDEYLNPKFSYHKNTDGSWTIKSKSTTSKEYIQKMVDANVIPEAEWSTETGGLTITNPMQMSPFTKGASESTRTQYNRGMNFYKDGKWLEIPYTFQEGRQVKKQTSTSGGWDPNSYKKKE